MLCTGRVSPEPGPGRIIPDFLYLYIMAAILILFGALSIIVFIVTTILVYNYLVQRNQKTENFLFINLFIFRYLKLYSEFTRNETGRTGPLYYIWLISVNIALVCFILIIVFFDKI